MYLLFTTFIILELVNFDESQQNLSQFKGYFSKVSLNYMQNQSQLIEDITIVDYYEQCPQGYDDDLFRYIYQGTIEGCRCTDGYDQTNKYITQKCCFPGQNDIFTTFSEDETENLQCYCYGEPLEEIPQYTFKYALIYNKSKETLYKYKGCAKKYKEVTMLNNIPYYDENNKRVYCQNGFKLCGGIQNGVCIPNSYQKCPIVKILGSDINGIVQNIQNQNYEEVRFSQLDYISEQKLVYFRQTEEGDESPLLYLKTEIEKNQICYQDQLLDVDKTITKAFNFEKNDNCENNQNQGLSTNLSVQKEHIYYEFNQDNEKEWLQLYYNNYQNQDGNRISDQEINLINNNLKDYFYMQDIINHPNGEYSRFNSKKENKIYLNQINVNTMDTQCRKTYQFTKKLENQIIQYQNYSKRFIVMMGFFIFFIIYNILPVILISIFLKNYGNYNFAQDLTAIILVQVIPAIIIKYGIMLPIQLTTQQNKIDQEYESFNNLINLGTYNPGCSLNAKWLEIQNQFDISYDYYENLKIYFTIFNFFYVEFLVVYFLIFYGVYRLCKQIQGKYSTYSKNKQLKQAKIQQQQIQDKLQQDIQKQQKYQEQLKQDVILKQQIDQFDEQQKIKSNKLEIQTEQQLGLEFEEEN